MGREAKQRQPKTRITIRIDRDLLEHFKAEAAKAVHSENPSGYQTLICEALHECLDTREYLAKVVQEKRHGSTGLRQ